MSHPYTLNIAQEQAQEMPMVDLAFLILKSANNTFYYRDLMNEIAKIKGIGEEEVNENIAQLYTEINIDGRFACVGGNLWGLKRWYPSDKSEDGVTNPERPRIINDDDDDEDDLVDESELFEEDEERPSKRKRKKSKRDELGDDFDEDDDDDIDDDDDEDADDELDDELEDDYDEDEELEDEDDDLEEDDDDDDTA